MPDEFAAVGRVVVGDCCWGRAVRGDADWVACEDGGAEGAVLGLACVAALCGAASCAVCCGFTAGAASATVGQFGAVGNVADPLGWHQSWVRGNAWLKPAR